MITIGFKKLSIKELETLLSPALIGMPLKQFKKIEEEAEELEEKEISKLTTEGANVFIMPQEQLEFFLDSQKQLKKFSGNGTLTVVNNSKKSRIWDARISVDNTPNVNLEENDVLVLGNLDPTENKVLKYVILENENIKELLDYREEIEIEGIQKERTEDVITNFDKAIITSSSEFEEPERLDAEKKIEIDFENQIKEIESEISRQKESVDGLERDKKNKEDLFKESKAQLAHLQGKLDNIKSTKTNNFSSELNDLFKAEVQDTQDVLKKIDGFKESISKIEKDYEKYQEESKDINQEFDSKISEINKELTEANKTLADLNEKLASLEREKNTQEGMFKGYEKDLKKANKNKKKAIKKEEPKSVVDLIENKIKELEEKTKKTAGDLDDINEKIEELMPQKEEKEENVNNLNNKLKETGELRKKQLSEKLEALTGYKSTEELENKLQAEREELKNYENNFSKLKKINKKLDKQFDDQISGTTEEIVKEKKNIKEIEAFLEDLTSQIEEKKKKVSQLLEEIENKGEEKLKEIKKLREKIRKQKSEYYKYKKNHVLLLNQRNLVNFNLYLHNTTEYSFNNLVIEKQLSQNFSNIRVESDIIHKSSVLKDRISIDIFKLEPNQKINLTISAVIEPTKKEQISTGNVNIAFDMEKTLISKVDFSQFSAFTHSLHAIKLKERETEPNVWKCQFIFSNNSDLNIQLKSISVMDDKKQTHLINQTFGEGEKGRVATRKKYISEAWEVNSVKEPKFYRKVQYSVIPQFKASTNVHFYVEENDFKMVDLITTKRFSTTSIKSFEETSFDATLSIKNTSTIPVKNLIIKELIPADFLPPKSVEDLKIRTSSGSKEFKHIRFSVVPDDEDPSHEHEMVILLDDREKNYESVIELNDFLEIKYPMRAMSPDYNKDYEFPSEVNTFFFVEPIKMIHQYNIRFGVPAENLPKLKIVHKRRNLVIGKQIFPGRTVNEFGISIFVNNNSNVEINDLKIDDLISNSFELVSSNIDNQITASGEEEGRKISFNINSILPYEEKEIRYYVKNTSGKDVAFDELESVLFG